MALKNCTNKISVLGLQHETETLDVPNSQEKSRKK